MNDKVTIKIPRPLYNRLKEIVQETGFDSVTDLVVFCMRDIVSSKDEEGVRDRLKKLGYDV